MLFLDFVNRLDEVKIILLYLSLCLVNLDIIKFLVIYFDDIDCLDNNYWIFVFIVVIVGNCENFIFFDIKGVDINYIVFCLDFKVLMEL